MAEAGFAAITGAASGIGMALARELAARGWKVAVCDRDAVGASRVAAELPGAIASAFDVTDRDATLVALHALWDTHGPIDLLVNNAGIGIGGEYADIDAASWRRIIDVNLFGVVHGIDALYPRMLARRSGHIVNVASLLGLLPLPGEAPYVASKYAVLGLSHALRAEACDLGVKVSVVCPGRIDTPIYDSSPILGFDKDRVLSLWPAAMSPQACARGIRRGIERNRATILVAGPVGFLWVLHRLSPSLFVRAAGFYMRRVRGTRG